LHPLKVMKIIVEKEPPRIDRRKWDANLAALVEVCLQKDPSKRPTMDEINKNHCKFFTKARVEPLVDILQSLPPLEKRINQKPPLAEKKETARAAATGSWDFSADDLDDGASDDFGVFEGIGEEES